MVYACHAPMVTLQGFPPAAASYSDQALPAPANENLFLKAPWVTAAEAMQTVKRIKHRLQRENARDHVLLASAERRRVWEEVLVCERCLRWKYFR